MELGKAVEILRDGGGMFAPQAQAAAVVLGELDELRADRAALQQLRYELHTIFAVEWYEEEGCAGPTVDDAALLRNVGDCVDELAARQAAEDEQARL
jgi:hypothetical protein